MHYGEPFKLLGCLIDLDLRMHSCIDQLLGKIRPKSVAILSTRAYYATAELINQYKSHIWGLVEIPTGAYFHAASGLLDKIWRVQRNFLEKTGGQAPSRIIWQIHFQYCEYIHKSSARSG